MLLRSARGCTLTPESYEENRYTPPREEMISSGFLQVQKDGAVD